MKSGDIIKIRNNAGILEVKLIEKLNLKNIGRIGLCSFTNCRLEFHKSLDEQLITTLYDEYKGNEEIYIIFTNQFYDPEVFKAKLLGFEKPEHMYQTIK